MPECNKFSDLSQYGSKHLPLSDITVTDNLLFEVPNSADHNAVKEN